MAGQEPRDVCRQKGYDPDTSYGTMGASSTLRNKYSKHVMMLMRLFCCWRLYSYLLLPH
ncbi:hypothetical protein M378DRAFT_160767 [Amanita muscaria Koide BX008]|uniref:Uncharacterized protein n=1 Tax=Amanita muscaria (strain Koide BX008) TaxID=946122 RepID=A0A0C2XBW9_AMAMK|nr:hypothetical protein M378DRAFT_160767 [Amanita muscaria Koide BX008]